MKKTKSKKRNSGRIQSWFRFNEYKTRGEAHIAARKAKSARIKAGLEASMALISKSRIGEFAYYVGKMHQILGLKSRFEVVVK